jgi:hypothetical protein
MNRHERPFLDVWSLGHLATGAACALAGLSPSAALTAAVVWEAAEYALDIAEYPTNRAVDVVLNMAGYFAVRLFLNRRIKA